MRRSIGSLALVAGLAACGSGPAPAPAPAPEPSGESAASPRQAGSPTARTASPTGPESCSALAARLPLAEQVGQLFMVGKDTGTPVDAAYTAMLQRTHTGHVLLLGNTEAGTAGVKALTDDLRAAAGPPTAGVGLFVAADQEGGRIQRLSGPGFDDMPSANAQAELGDAELRTRAAGWGRQLRAAGVDVDLAPVADIVPESLSDTNAPVGQLEREYGTDARTATPKVRAFVAGMADAEVGTSLKHFPGLGHVRGNTDFASGVIDRQVGRDHAGLAVFRAGIADGADMVMVSTATYALIDPDQPATFSRVVVTDLLRDELGFDRVVVSDDLGPAAQVADVPPAERGVRFLAAGGDLVVNGDPGLHPEMVRAVLTKAQTDPQFAAEVRTKVTRVLEMKARYGAVGCEQR